MICTECGCYPCRGSLCDGPAPELPEGYRVQEDGKSLQQSIHGKWHQLAYRNPDDTISCFSRDMEPNELIAIAAFVQGAR